MQARPRRRFAIALHLVALAAAAASAADLRPSWECLPEDTAVMVHVPGPARFLETMRTRTKFGAVALGPDRMQKAWALAVEAWGGTDDAPGSVEEMEKRLAKYGLAPDDMEAMFAGDMGMGLVMRRRDEGLAPLVMALAWAEPGEEAAGKAVAAFRRLVEDAPQGEAAPQRVDVEMAGHEVTWVSRPILRADLGQVKVEGGLDAERLKELRAELAERAKQAPKITVGKVHLFLARVGGRLVAGQTMPPPPGGLRVGMEPQPGGKLALNVNAAGPAAPAADVDPDRVSGTDEARGLFERFLAAHAAGDASPLADVLRAAGMRDALPPGEPLFDAVLDPRPFLDMTTGGDAEMKRRLAAVGLGEIGPIAVRESFDGGRLRQGIFATLPAPRTGLLRILEQKCDAAEVPSFVTSEAVDFTQISLDLAEAYRTLKDFAVAEGGEQAVNMFATAEAQAQGWLGVELEAMLANLGSRHWIVSYPPQVAAALEQARRNREGDAEEAATSSERLAFVWKLADDGPVLAVLPKIAALAQQQVVEEQGFQGVRVPGGVAVFAGNGHLVVGMGGDALEKTLAGIRNPPAGEASLREGHVPRKGADLVGLAPCRMFAVGDATRTGGMLGELRDLVTAMVPDDVEDRYRDLLAKAKALVPPADEMQGMFGVGASVMQVNDAGVSLESAWEMPAP